MFNIKCMDAQDITRAKDNGYPYSCELQLLYQLEKALDDCQAVIRSASSSDDDKREAITSLYPDITEMLLIVKEYKVDRSRKKA